MVSVWLVKQVGSTETLLVDAGSVSGYTQTAGSRLRGEGRRSHDGRQHGAARQGVAAATAEPSAWKATATDSTAGLQDEGQVGLSAYANGSVTNGPLVFAFDDLEVGGKAVPHAAPVAGFTHTASGLQSSFDSSTTTTSNKATITGYAWDFGDGTNGTAASPNHTYDAAGTYPVSLVVTDSRGSQSAPVTKSVTVTHADPTASFVLSTTSSE